MRSNITRAQYDFTLRTHSLDVHYQHPTLPQVSAPWTADWVFKAHFKKMCTQVSL